MITIDIDDSHIEEVSKFKTFKERIIFIKGDSVSQEVIKKVSEIVKGHPALVTLDSDHTKTHVLKEMSLYSDFVSLNSYPVVQDTNINGPPVLSDFGEGSMEAVEEFLKDNDRFEIDRSRELLVTFYPSGYLKRVKP